MANVSVRMIRDTLDDIPRFPLAEGYRFRTFRAGDEATWTGLQQAAEPFLTITDALFPKEFGDRPEALPSRMFFLETETGETAGTITAWWQSNWRQRGDWGQIHWVAVHPDYQGRGLSKSMMSRAMDCLAKHHRRAMLGTSTGRLGAIKVYLDFGFRPDAADLAQTEVRQGWIEVQDALNHPGLRTGLDGPAPAETP